MEEFKRKVEEAAGYIRRNVADEPKIGLILGTGLGDVARAIDETSSLSYERIPHFPLSTVVSHRGRLVFGELAGRPVVALQGRFHLYEGYSPLEISFPIRVLKQLGIEVLIVSGAAGGLNPHYKPADLMLITDHINLTGYNPLRGPNVEAWGPRFPDMAEPYSKRLQKLTHRTALEEKLLLHRGVYVGVHGPSLETAAETRFLRMIGGDAVGMSIVMEVITAVHAGMEVLGFAIITNVNLPDCYQPASVDEIIATAEKAGRPFMNLLEKIVAKI